jgi:hypothetical protein
MTGKYFWDVIQSRKGSADTTLLLIPLLVLFLIGMQLSISIFTRNQLAMSTQNAVSTRAVSGDFLNGDRFVYLGGSSDSRDLALLVGTSERRVPSVVSSFFLLTNQDLVLGNRSIALVEGN